MKPTTPPPDQTPAPDGSGDKETLTPIQLADLAAKLPTSDPRTRTIRDEREQVRAALRLYQAARELLEGERRIEQAGDKLTGLPLSLPFEEAAWAVGFKGEKAAFSLERLMTKLGWRNASIMSARKNGLSLPAVAQLREALKAERSRRGRMNRSGRTG